MIAYGYLEWCCTTYIHDAGTADPQLLWTEDDNKKNCRTKTLWSSRYTSNNMIRTKKMERTVSHR